MHSSIAHQGQVRELIRLLEWTRIRFDLPGYRGRLEKPVLRCIERIMSWIPEVLTQLQFSLPRRPSQYFVVPIRHD